MLSALRAKHPRDKDLPERAANLAFFRAVLDGSVYDVLSHDYHVEYIENEYVPLAQRRPSVRHNLCRITVEEVASLIFDDARFPRIEDAKRATISETCTQIIKEAGLAALMVQAVIVGSVGSVAILMRVLKGRLFFDVLATDFLTPRWQPEAPDTLLDVTERYKVKGADLEADGYDLKAILGTRRQNTLDGARASNWWFQRRWTLAAEEWYVPVPVRDENGELLMPSEIDPERSVTHNLGFVPMVWIRNLGNVSGGRPIDGPCVFAGAIETQIEMEYLLSQGARGLKYSADPWLVISDDDVPGSMVKSAGNALVTSEKGDAKLLEIHGSASQALVDYARYLRQCALETLRANRSDPEKMSVPQSGRAIELLNHGLAGLVGDYRLAYGNDGLLRLIKMVFAAARVMPLSVGRKRIMAPADIDLGLKWPLIFPASEHDRLEGASTLKVLVETGLMSRETATGVVAEEYDVPNARGEIARIEAERAAEDKRARDLAAMTKATEQLTE